MIIYKVTNTINGKVYIGKTTKALSDRKSVHLKNIRSGISTKFYNTIRKYGIDNFVWEVLDCAEDVRYLNELECKYISEYKSFSDGYNMTIGGDGGDTISNKSPEDKKRQGAKRGNVPWNKGLNMKDMGYDCFKNRKPRSKFSEEQKAAHSSTIKQSEAYRNGLLTRRPAKQNVMEDEFGNVWNTQKEWAAAVGITTKYMIAKVLSGTPYKGVRYNVKSKK